MIVLNTTLSKVSDEVQDESRTYQSVKNYKLPAITKDEIAKNPGGLSWAEYPYPKEETPRSLCFEKVEEDV